MEMPVVDGGNIPAAVSQTVMCHGGELVGSVMIVPAVHTDSYRLLADHHIHPPEQMILIAGAPDDTADSPSQMPRGHCIVLPSDY